MAATLFHIPYSPWSLKARFALRHHAIPVNLVEYKPLFDEPAMRFRLRQLRGRITVPVLMTEEEGGLVDSWDIAQYADRRGRGAQLIPPDELDPIEQWNQASERLAAAGRARAIVRASGDFNAVRESLPATVRDLPLLNRPLGRQGLALFARKYSISESDRELHGRAMRAELDGLRHALADGRKYLLGDFSYADVSMAFALQLVEPLADTQMGPATRRAATDTELTTDYADLLTWRNRLNADHDLVLSSID